MQPILFTDDNLRISWVCRCCAVFSLPRRLAQFVGHTNAHKAFRSFLRLSGSTDSFLDMQEIKKSLKIKRINCAPVRTL